MSALKEDTRVNSEPFGTLSENGGVLQNTSDGTTIDKASFSFPPKDGWGLRLRLLLSLVLFYFHVVVIFDVIGEMLRCKAWLLENMEPNDAGKLLLLGCFFALLLAHVTEAAMGSVFSLDTAVTQYYRRCLLHHCIDDNTGLRRHSAEVSLETSRHADRDNRGADVWLFDGVLVRGSTGSLAALLGRR